MYDWSVFPPTLLATCTGAGFAAGTSLLLAWRAGHSRHREIMSERVRSVVETLIAWNAAERKQREESELELEGVPVLRPHALTPDQAKVEAASAAMLLALESYGKEQEVSTALRRTIVAVDHRETPDDKADALTRANAALINWWTGQIRRRTCLSELAKVARGE